MQRVSGITQITVDCIGWFRYVTKEYIQTCNNGIVQIGCGGIHRAGVGN